MKTVANKQKICDVLMEAAKTDKDIVALCSDSRGSGSFTPFAATYPEHFDETTRRFGQIKRTWNIYDLYGIGIRK